MIASFMVHSRVMVFLVAGSLAGNAAAQTVECAANDISCLAGRAVYTAVVSAHDQDGILQYAVGTLCGDAQLQALGRTRYSQTLPQVVQSARNAFLQSGVGAAAADHYLQSLPTLVKTARSAEASGVLAGLRSAFAMYPGSKSEYCSRMKATLR